ncbi:MAG: hypothetical protein JSR34_11710 [Proteobacteria bacterium]|nr:hypothetical protein [Pseudomonadota bacterium]
MRHKPQCIACCCAHKRLLSATRDGVLRAFANHSSYRYRRFNRFCTRAKKKGVPEHALFRFVATACCLAQLPEDYFLEEAAEAAGEAAALLAAEAAGLAAPEAAALLAGEADIALAASLAAAEAAALASEAAEAAMPVSEAAEAAMPVSEAAEEAGGGVWASEALEAALSPLLPQAARARPRAAAIRILLMDMGISSSEVSWKFCFCTSFWTSKAWYVHRARPLIIAHQ